ncbi:hypothetical protein CVV72_11375 [Amycolatopsis sp. TNS106]|nr:hypothetical protein CVV72_11375 [Amycolatopsis sp. TNS106]
MKATVAVLVATLVVPVPEVLAQPGAAPSPIHQDRSTSVTNVPFAPWQPQEPVVTTEAPTAPVSWPKPGDRVAKATSSDRAAGGVTVTVHDRNISATAGITGVVVDVRADDRARTAKSKTTLQLDYTSFSGAIGGDWASRLKLFALPPCAAVTPAKPECQIMTPVPSRNDHHAKQVTAEVEVNGEGSVFALAADADGVGGDYKAGKLAPSATWQVGTNTGSFSWSHPMRTPPVPGKLQPELELSYSAGSVDGRTASTNTQPSWIGEGWDLWPGQITRSYRLCTDDTTVAAKRTGDQCWAGDDYVSIVSGSISGELVYDPGKKTWKAGNDDGSRVERLTGANNGDNDGEHWKVTSTDGTQYFFGSRGKDETQSTWVVPVIGNDAGEPCHDPAIKDFRCDQAWQWNLDKVVDRHGNTIHYFYEKEENSYGFLRGKEAARYTRGGVLKRIEYGTNEKVKAPAPARVILDSADRCVPGRDCGKRDKESWPDVPWDQQCDSGTCKDKQSPTFFSAKRLAKVTTEIWDGVKYTPVDSWTLTPSYPNPGDGTSAQLWLQEVQHTGMVGTPVSSPPMSFVGVARPNRVNAPNDGLPPVNKIRLYAIRNETGGVLQVNWLKTDCDVNALPAPESNGNRCYPVRWRPEGSEERTDWFHKYVVRQTVQTDQVGSAPTEVVNYDYEGPGAWAYHDNRLVKDSFRDWSQWRGYEKVLVSKGNPNDPVVKRTAIRYQYYRGMHGDRLNRQGGKKDARIIDSSGAKVEDLPGFNGFQREKIVYNGLNGPEVSSEITEPMRRHSAVNFDSTRVSFMAREERKVTRTALPAVNGKRESVVRTKYDDYGMPIEVWDEGDVAIPADDRCSKTTYAQNTAAWVLDAESRVEEVRVGCGTTPSYPRDAVNDVKTTFDSREPGRALPVLIEKVQSYAGTTPNYIEEKKATFDVYGRELDVFDPLNRKTTTRFEPETGLARHVVVTNPLGHQVKTTNNLSWGQPELTVDMNGRRTELAYDAFGRLAEVWKPGRSKDAGDSGNLIYRYSLNRDKASSVETETLTASGSHIRSFDLFDGFLRARQTQKQAWGGGRIVTDEQYDSRGLAVRKNSPYFSTGEPESGLVKAADNEVPGQTVIEHDGAERETKSTFVSHNQPKHETLTRHWGDHTDVIPPLGDTTKSTYVDVRGKTTELRQFKGREPVGEFDSTKYTYTETGEQESTTDALGNKLSSRYNLLGQKVETNDPDRGISTMDYDPAGQLRSKTDARGNKLFYRYDAIGRKIEERTGSESGPLITKWAYDQPGALGQLASSTRFVGAEQYVYAITDYDAEYRPARTEVRIPASETGVAGTYVTGQAYRADGSPASTVLPQIGDLPEETLVYGYDGLGLLRTLKGAGKDYISDLIYTKYGEQSQIHQGGTHNHLWQTRYYEPGTRRVAQVLTERERAGAVLANDAKLGYDPSGNVTKVSNNSREDGLDVQCFTYDHLRRNLDAWTSTKEDCAAAGSNVGGPGAYWTSYTYDRVGNRRTEREHGLGGAKDTLRTYEYDAGKPHAVSKIVTALPDGTAKEDGFGYERNGVTNHRPGPDGKPQSLAWNEEDRLTTVTTEGKTSTTIYDADGKPLIVREAGTTTLFLAGGELRVDTVNGTKSAVRFYSDGTSDIAVRTEDKVAYQVHDQQGTPLALIDSGTLVPSRRLLDQFGEPRRQDPVTFPRSSGFVGGTRNDTTGLTKLGVRDYDPSTGRFLSVDPLAEPANPQQLNGFAYSNNNPATFNDASGMIWEDCYYDPASCKEPEPEVIHGVVANAQAATKKKHKLDAYVIKRITPVKGKGIQIFRAFIPEELALMGLLVGDKRGYSLKPDEPFRMRIVIDWEAGEVSFTVAHSKLSIGGEIPARPINPSINVGLWGSYFYTGLANHFKVQEEAPGKVKIDFKGINSVIPHCCYTKGTLSVDVTNDDTKVSMKGTPYPNFEGIQYRPGERPKFVATARWRSGAASDLVAPDRYQRWVNGYPQVR